MSSFIRGLSKLMIQIIKKKYCNVSMEVLGLLWKICSEGKYELLFQIHVKDKLLDQNRWNFYKKNLWISITWLLAALGKSLTETDYSDGRPGTYSEYLLCHSCTLAVVLRDIIFITVWSISWQSNPQAWNISIFRV